MVYWNVNLSKKKKGGFKLISFGVKKKNLEVCEPCSRALS